MPALIASALAFIASLSGVVIGLGIVIAFVVAAIADPSGWLNQSICFVIDMVVQFLPSTPQNLRLEGVVVTLSSHIPVIGLYAVREAFRAFRDIFSLIVIFKLYKMIPFKAT